MELPERLVFRGARAAAGEWRCPLSWPAFRDTGPIRQHLVAFHAISGPRMHLPQETICGRDERALHGTFDSRLRADAVLHGHQT